MRWVRWILIISPFVLVLILVAAGSLAMNTWGLLFAIALNSAVSYFIIDPGWRRRASRTGWAVIGVWLVLYGGTLFNVLGWNTYQNGWRAGSLSDYSVSNRLMQFLPVGWMFPTGEGYLLLGNASSRGANMNGKEISPSYFSTTMAAYMADRSFVTQPVAMHFRELRWRWFLSGETDIRANQFEKLDPTVSLPNDCTDSEQMVGSKAHGTIGGMIVEVAKVGSPWLWRTNEVIIHTGGTEFKEMSVVDGHIYDCVLLALHSGKQYRITYDNHLVRDPITQNTTYNLIAIANQ